MTEVSIISAIWIVIRSAGNNTKADVELPNLTAKHRLFASLNEKPLNEKVTARPY